MLGDEPFPNTPQYVLALSPPSSPPTADPAAAKPILHLHNLLRKNGTELKALQRDPSSADVELSTREKLIEYLIAKMNTESKAKVGIKGLEKSAMRSAGQLTVSHKKLDDVTNKLAEMTRRYNQSELTKR